jgi:hypothetical protein
MVTPLNCLLAQSINFNSYSSVTNQNFKRFLSLFEQRNLPLLTDLFISDVNIWDIKRTKLTPDQINSYLKYENKLIPGPLYYDQPADDLPSVPVNGVFYPLFKLPTNGNYVLLVFAQVDKVGISECRGMVFTLSYDLNGNFLYFSNYTYEPGSESLGGWIDTDLRSHHKYIVKREGEELVTPSYDETFSALEVHMTYQINANGLSTELSQEEVATQFKYNREECRFKRVN